MVTLRLGWDAGGAVDAAADLTKVSKVTAAANETGDALIDGKTGGFLRGVITLLSLLPSGVEDECTLNVIPSSSPSSLLFLVSCPFVLSSHGALLFSSSSSRSLR